MQERYGAKREWGEKNPKRVWWNDEIKAMVRRKETAWKEVLVLSDRGAKRKV